MSKKVGIGYSFKEASLKEENEELKKELAKLKAKADKKETKAKADK